MIIDTENKPSKISIDLCKSAVAFYGKHLLSNTLYKRLYVLINFEYIGNDYGYCDFEHDYYRPKEFIITLNKHLSVKQSLLCLAHEMVHVKQYAKGELKNYIRTNKSKWNNTLIDDEEIDYYERPWEIEAFGRELGLYLKFKESLK